jgi:hypothetical protein
MNTGTWVKHGKNYRLHGVAADGQPVHMYAVAGKSNHWTVWRFGLYVGGARRKANDWHNGVKSVPVTTGKGNVKPLLFALSAILAFAERIGRKEELQILWADKRRGRVYARLLNYPGWFETAEKDMYVYRNPAYWVFVGGEIGEYAEASS